MEDKFNERFSPTVNVNQLFIECVFGNGRGIKGVN